MNSRASCDTVARIAAVALVALEGVAAFADGAMQIVDGDTMAVA